MPSARSTESTSTVPSPTRHRERTPSGRNSTAPFHTKIINSTVRDATHVLDGLLYHETEQRIEEHYTDTAGFTDHVFALCHFRGFESALGIADLADKNL
ncbi:hypothetical protein LMG28727_07745 [Paraburkholderia kirstenboschensis]|nr:hypothetical protein LMG28727_07745 [Paraburkholderia kirstenboschensis]